MADMCDTCGDGVVQLLKKILEQERDSFTRLGQLTASGGVNEDVNLAGVGGVATTTGCGVATAGTQRVAVATDCVVLTSNNNGAGAAAVNIQDGGNSITVDGTVAIGSSVTPGTAATNLGKAEDSAHASGDVGVMALATGNVAQTARAADNDYIPLAVDLAGNLMAIGNLAHDAVDAGNPLKIGFQARTTIPTAVADADRVNGMADKFGRQIVQHGIRDLRGNQNTTITSSTAETTIVTAVATAMLDLYGIVIANTSGTACNVTIKDATAGTTRFIIAVPAGETRGFMLPACDGHKQAAVNNNWTATCSASVASIVITALTVQNIS